MSAPMLENDPCDIQQQLTHINLHKVDVHKVDVPKSNIAIIWTPIIEWHVDRCGSKSGYQKDMCSKEIGLMVKIY
jgi:hypothetical protein